MRHGGKPGGRSPWKPLRPTYGCIRVANEDQKKILEIVQKIGGTGIVKIKGSQKEKNRK